MSESDAHRRRGRTPTLPAMPGRRVAPRGASRALLLLLGPVAVRCCASPLLSDARLLHRQCQRRRCSSLDCVLDIDDEEAQLCRMDEMCIYFVTGNTMKEREVNAILSEVEIPFRVSHVDIDLPELQGDPLQIARGKCLEAASQVGSAVIVEDTSLCFTALKGMPGPYIKWFVEVSAARANLAQTPA